MSEWRFELTLLNGHDMWRHQCNIFFKIKNHKLPSMNRWPIHGVHGRRMGVHGRRMGVHAHSGPIPRLCDGYVTPLKWTLRRRFIDVAPMESSKVAYYTPMPRIWYLTGKRVQLRYFSSYRVEIKLLRKRKASPIVQELLFLVIYVYLFFK